ncbi:acyl-CoA dehydrogenase [Pseudomonas aeruginosa]|nr:acyl-CoA dehydrogenase [Pseudomonas aeruginosa]
MLGGHGYTREYPVEQYYRDNRLNPIHEGTHGIQSLDLLGRKVGQNNGAGLRQLTRLIQDACRRAEAHPSLAALRQPLERLVARLSEVTLALLGDLMQGQVNQGLANSALYLKVFGHAVIGWRWLEQAIRAEEGLARGDCADADFYRGKLQAARYFLTWEVPRLPPRTGAAGGPRRRVFEHAGRMVLILPALSRPVTSGAFVMSGHERRVAVAWRPRQRVRALARTTRKPRNSFEKTADAPLQSAKSAG